MASPHFPCLLSWTGGQMSSLGSRGKAPVGGLDWGLRPQMLKRSNYINFKRNCSNAVIDIGFSVFVHYIKL